jgi:hypothetical protein
LPEPREGTIVADASLVGSLRVAGEGGTPPRRRPVTYQVRVGSAVVHATVARGEISVAPGPDPAPDLVMNAGPGFRDVLAGLPLPRLVACCHAVLGAALRGQSAQRRRGWLCPHVRANGSTLASNSKSSYR